MPSLKPATPNDFASIEKLAEDIWSKHYVPIIGQGQVNYMLNKLYSAAALQKQTEEGQVFHLVLKDNKEIGFISVSNPDKKNYFLHKFYILQEKQNTGLGTFVFKKVFRELYQPESITLTVNRQNYKSINFYFKLGFKITKVEDFDIGNGYFMNDFVMQWKKS
ncbi:MAG TPA: GNAT family N-acetyltransferase [Bacteroidia bacterium]|jgi:RimJ/RimL family protein N-acetyltransferase|nr:GNAT family N-acetyltransferase [Bacteroidia bacterium]